MVRTKNKYCTVHNVRTQCNLLSLNLSQQLQQSYDD